MLWPRGWMVMSRAERIDLTRKIENISWVFKNDFIKPMAILVLLSNKAINRN